MSIELIHKINLDGKRQLGSGNTVRCRVCGRDSRRRLSQAIYGARCPHCLAKLIENPEVFDE